MQTIKLFIKEKLLSVVAGSVLGFNIHGIVSFLVSMLFLKGNKDHVLMIMSWAFPKTRE